MAVFETLLHRFCTQPNVIDLPLELQAFAKRTGPALENAWFAWAKAYAEMETGHPHLAHAWLTSGRAAQREASDPVLDAEFYSAEARVWIAVDEPRSARGRPRWPGRSGSRSRRSLARRIAPPARVLMKGLYEPHPATDVKTRRLPRWRSPPSPHSAVAAGGSGNDVGFVISAIWKGGRGFADSGWSTSTRCRARVRNGRSERGVHVALGDVTIVVTTENGP